MIPTYSHKGESNSMSFDPFMKLFKRLPNEQVKEMLEKTLMTSTILNKSLCVLVLAILGYAILIFLNRKLVRVLKDVIAEDNYKMDTIKRTEALELKQEALQQQIVHLEQELTESNQLLQRQLEEQERLGSTQHNSLQSRLNILDRFREDSNRWSKFQHDQEFRNRRLSEATTSVSSRVTKLEIKYTTAIRDLQKKMRKMDHTAAGNFKVVAKYTEAIQTYCAENEEKLQKMAEAIFDIHDQVNQELHAFQTQIKDLEYKLARLQSAYSSYSSITKRREAPPAKDKGSKDKQPDIANEAASLKSTLKCVKPIDEAL